MILVVDPEDKNHLQFILLDKKGNKIVSYKGNSKKPLEELNLFLKKNNLCPSDIKALFIFEKVGSFTALRNLAAIANVWQNTYKLKVFGITKDQLKESSLEQVVLKQIKKTSKKIFIPLYSAPPNITLKK